MASNEDVEQSVSETEDGDNRHSVWLHLVKAGKNAADMTVDVAAIGGISWMAVSGVEAATLQVVGAMVVSVALGKRYYQNQKP